MDAMPDSPCDYTAPYIQAEVLQLYTVTNTAANGPPGSTVQQFYAPAPEPGTLALFGVGIGVLGALRRRRRTG